MAFVRVAAISDIPENSVRAFEVGDEHIAVYHCNGTFYATDNICTHSYAELSEGYLDTDDCSIECPLHGARFDIATGAILALPAYTPLKTFAVQIQGDDLLVEQDAS